MGGLLQDDALAATDDERQHAVATHGQRYAHAITNQADCLFYDKIITPHLFTFLPFYYFTFAQLGGGFIGQAL